MPATTPMLEVNNLYVHYGGICALHQVSLHVDPSEIIAVIGANGAGKSTFLRTITGLLATRREQVMFDGRPIGGLPANVIVKLGIAMVPEGRRLFPSLTVEENLLMGAYGRRTGPWSLDRIYQLFPVLRERRANAGTALSGGQQQMVAIGRALMSNPTLLLCDEISLGLAPIVIKDIYRALTRITAEGMTVLVVEQDINQALAVASRVYCFQEGRVTLQGRPTELTREQIGRAYFGA